MDTPSSPAPQDPSTQSLPLPSDRTTPPPRSAEEALERVWADPRGLIGRLKALQNDAIGIRIIATAFIFFLVGGINALLIRTQLIRAENTFLGPQAYNQIFTMHGSTMMYLFVVPIVEGLAILLLPFMLGNREMPFPRLGVFSYFTFLFGGILFYSSFLFGEVPDAGWFAYVPLSGPQYSPGLGMDFWLLALSVAEVAAIAAGVEIIIAILQMRAPGMSISRMPLYAWAMLVTAFSILFAFTPLIVGSLMMELDRKFGTQFFNPQAGGDPLLWQHIFWIFGHPEVYIQFLPAVGILAMIIPVFARRRIAGYTFIAMALVATGFISFGLWVHHMFTVGLPAISMTFFAAASVMIAIPSGVQVVAYIATIWNGRPVWRTPFLFAIGFLVLFVLGGITGVMVGSIPFDWQVHDSYFVVAHFHYVLIGGVTFPLFAALYYWIPKWTGKMLDERLGKWNFWLMFIGFNLTFFPMHIVGLLGMPRRVYTYQAGMGWDIYNLIATIGAFILASGILIFLVNILFSMQRGEPAGDNPWEADSLEWATSSPPPNYGFATLPIVHSRHPLWEQEQIHEGDERIKRLTLALSRWPLTWRAALVTSVIDGRPEEVFRVSGPSIWPFFASIGMITIFASEIWDLHLVTLIGALILIGSIIAWLWPEKAGTTEAEEQAFEEEHGVRVLTSGSFAVARGGMWLTILILGIALSAFLLSYLYIRLVNPIWPPDNVPMPRVIFPVIGLILLLAGAAAMNWALRSIRAGNQTGLRIALAVAFVLGASAAGIQIYDFTQYGFNWTLNAYASIFYLLGGFMIAVVIGGVLINALVHFWAWRGEYSPRRHVAVEITALFWYAIVVGWLITFGTLYLAPYWT